MNLYLIKNNFKLMFRNTWSLLVLVVGPILVIALLSSAFKELMKSYEGVDKFFVGYRLSYEIQEKEMIENIKKAGKENDIYFYEYPEGDIEDIIQKNELAGFVDFKEDKYVIYTSDDYEIEGITLEYFMNKVMNVGIDTYLQIDSRQKIDLPVEKLHFMPAVDAKDYYGIIEIVYFCWCGIICATGVLSNEKKYGIVRRFQVSNMSECKNYLGKFIPIILTVTVGMLAASVITILFFDIHWGNAFMSMLIVFIMILAGTSLGSMLYNISNNLVITVILQFSIVWIMGFLGGSFETYMFSSTPEMLKKISPLYHTNRALVELSCMGESNYIFSAVIYSIAITIVCSAIAILSGYIRKRGRA